MGGACRDDGHRKRRSVDPAAAFLDIEMGE
jgi:hypothetical protein